MENVTITHMVFRAPNGMVFDAGETRLLPDETSGFLLSFGVLGEQVRHLITERLFNLTPESYEEGLGTHFVAGKLVEITVRPDKKLLREFDDIHDMFEVALLLDMADLDDVLTQESNYHVVKVMQEVLGPKLKIGFKTSR